MRLAPPATLGLVVALLVGLALLVAQLHPYLADYGDDAEFLILGQGLARGQGYAWVNTPGNPAHNRYPPGYPAYLAATLAVSGTRNTPLQAVLPAKIATALTYACAVALLWPLARRRLPFGWAAAAVALFALNPFVIRFASQVMSDVPYVPSLLLALVWADRISDRKASIWSWAGLGALLALGGYVRSEGLAAAGGVLLWAWLRTDRPRAVAASAVFAALMLPWWLRDLTLAGGWRYLQQLASVQDQNPDAGSVGAGGLVARVLGNGLFVLGKPGAFGAMGLAGGLVVLAVVVIGYWRDLRSANGAAEWAAPALVLAVLVWPIRTGRFLLPVVPLAGVYALAGALLIAGWLGSHSQSARAAGATSLWTRLLGAAVGLALLLEAVYAGRESLANVRALQGGGDGATYYHNRPDWSHYIEAADWLRANAAAGDVVMARRHFAMYVYSGHLTEKYRFDVSEDELAYLTSGTEHKYVVEDAFGRLRGDFTPLPATLESRGGGLVLQYETAEPAVRVWELVRPPGTCCVKSG